MNEQTFCIVQFNGSMLASGFNSMAGTVQIQIGVAVARFEANPCQCRGCRDFSGEVDRFGGRSDTDHS